MKPNPKELENQAYQQAVKLPLWRSTLEKMRTIGLNYGMVFPTKFFEDNLKAVKGESRLNFGIMRINKKLIHEGFYLSSKGQKGNQYVIIPANSIHCVMDNWAHSAAQALKRGVILGTNTKTDTLSPEDKRRHDASLQSICMKRLLMGKSKQIQRMVESQQPVVLDFTENNQAVNE